MPQFRYRALTPAGEIVVGEVDAPSREEVVRRIEYLGHMPIEAEAATQGMFGARGRIGKPPRPRDITIFLRQLALLVGSGLTLEGALQTLADDTAKAMVAICQRVALVHLGRRQFCGSVGPTSNGDRPGIRRDGPRGRGFRQAGRGPASHRGGSHATGTPQRALQRSDPLPDIPCRVGGSDPVVSS